MFASFYRRLTQSYGTRTVIGGGVLVLILLGYGASQFLGTSDTAEEATATKKVVSVSPISTLRGQGGTLSVLGTVEATREARLITEASGRVTSVPVTLGQNVRAGTVLATIENSRERAVVLQAQGAYESALAGANSSGASLATAERGLAEAEISARNTFRSSFTTVDGVIRGTVDTFFSDPDGAIPGLLIDGQGSASSLSALRVDLGDMLASWGTASPSTDAAADLLTAEANAKRVSAFLATLAKLYAEDKNVAPNLADKGTLLASARAQVDGTLSALSGARSSLIAAENAVTQARIAGESGVASLSDAQVKQALGALRLAQANLEKTIVRSPITGTVQSLTVKEGTSVGQGAPAAIVSSEGALEVVAYVTESDARSITVGSKALVEGSVTGVVTAIASAVDPLTKKIELRVGVEGSENVLTNGQAVTVSLEALGSTDTVEATGDILLPIVSLKMTPDGAVVFTVDNGKLVAHPVVLGAIRGDRVVVESGLDTSWSLVSDARGLRAGEEVEVK